LRKRGERKKWGERTKREQESRVKAIWAQISQSLKNSVKPFGVN